MGRKNRRKAVKACPISPCGILKEAAKQVKFGWVSGTIKDRNAGMPCAKE